jgi:hypothetical protein
MAVEHSIPDETGVVITRISPPQELAGELGGQLLDLERLELGGHLSSY